MIAEAEIQAARRRALGSAIFPTLLAPLVGTGAVKCLAYLGLIETPGRTAVLIAVLAVWPCLLVSGMLARQRIKPALFRTLLDPNISFADKRTAVLRSVLGSLLLVLWLQWTWKFINGTF